MAYPYFDVFESSIQHHEKRARYWMQQGKPDYAAGSKAKADKWRAKRASFDAAFRPALPPGPVADLMEAKLKQAERDLAEAMEESIYRSGGRQEAWERIDRMASVHSIPDMKGTIDRSAPQFWRTKSY